MPTLGLTEVEERRIALQIPANAVVTCTKPLLGDSRFVEVEWNGKTLALFGSDMRDRGEPILNQESSKGRRGRI